MVILLMMVNLLMTKKKEMENILMKMVIMILGNGMTIKNMVEV